MKDEALRLALDELVRVYHEDEAGSNTLEVIKTIKQALEQPEPEPFGYFRYDLRLDAWVMSRHANVGIPFYTSPPKREPLTDGGTHCKAKRENGGVCPHHNLQCGWPKCNEAAPPKREPLEGVIDVRPIGHHSLQLIFRSQTDIAKFKAAHGIKGEA